VRVRTDRSGRRDERDNVEHVTAHAQGAAGCKTSTWACGNDQSAAVALWFRRGVGVVETRGGRGWGWGWWRRRVGVGGGGGGGGVGWGWGWGWGVGGQGGRTDVGQADKGALAHARVQLAKARVMQHQLQVRNGLRQLLGVVHTATHPSVQHTRTHTHVHPLMDMDILTCAQGERVVPLNTAHLHRHTHKHTQTQTHV
jgi:hypothetical protein